MVTNILLIVVALTLLSVLFGRKIRCSSFWRATVTPLASIIGSGFLVVAPLLAMTAGWYSLAAIIVLVAIGYACGEVIRFNISRLEPLVETGRASTFIRTTERLSQFFLSLAYIISVAFYLKLLTAFVFRAARIESDFYSNLLTSALILSIAAIGKLRGFNMLEHLEEYSVNIKLAIIAGFIAALAYFNIDLFLLGQWKLDMPKQELTWSTIRTLAGSLIIVQGFETSRFLGSKYSADERIRTMRVAQILSGLIYIAFIGLIAVVFKKDISNSETGIIDLSMRVSSLLPATLIVAAVLSQFSAGIADTIGSGGLLSEALGKRTSVGTNYLIIGVLGVALIWTFGIYGIISFASRAFALYYGLQAVEATALAASARDRYRTIWFGLLAILLFGITIFGAPA
jgi:hypothetical protein